MLQSRPVPDLHDLRDHVRRVGPMSHHGACTYVFPSQIGMIRSQHLMTATIGSRTSKSSRSSRSSRSCSVRCMEGLAVSSNGWHAKVEWSGAYSPHLLSFSSMKVSRQPTPVFGNELVHQSAPFVCQGIPRIRSTFGFMNSFNLRTFSPANFK